MRWTQTHIPTLRDEPASVQSVSHKLLLRAGYAQQLMAGVYSLLPLAQRVRQKIIGIIRESMNEINGQEFLLPALQPHALWEQSGRAAGVSDVMFRLKDRKGTELALGLTHEEVFATIAKSTLNSYKQLPQIWYQIQTKFRDEARPRAGLLRVREFTMKDSYSFDLDEDGLDRSFNLHKEAYKNIFDRCRIDYLPVEASSGAMGGNTSIEFMVAGEAGEDSVVTCPTCGYAANIEKARSACPSFIPDEASAARSLEKFATPLVKTIKQLEAFEPGHPAGIQIKTLLYLADDALVIALVEGGQELNETKLQSTLGAATLRQAQEHEIIAALGASPGSLGACGVQTGKGQPVRKIIADARLENRSGMVTGANEDGFHLRNVVVSRDIAVDTFTDLHNVQPGERCAECNSEGLAISTALEIGHIFKLGTRYSETMNVTVLQKDGKDHLIQMGSYGIGVERLMAAIIEQHNDENGIIWPLSVAPYTVSLVPVNIQNEELRNSAEELYGNLRQSGIEVLFDDRDERAGVKFKDADLIGIPYRITVGKKAQDGIVELKCRGSGSQALEMPLMAVLDHLKGEVS